MGAPVQLPGLPVATAANDGDTILLRQGLTDYQCSLALARQINVQNMSALPSNLALSDMLIVNRIITGTPTNFKVPFSNVGYIAGTMTWFYMSSAQITASLPGWSIVPNTGDSLLSCAGGSVYTTANTRQGSWTQPSFSLTASQIPAHTHLITIQRGSTTGSSTEKVSAASSSSGSTDDGSAVQSFGSGAAIQLSNAWRPFACVGNVCVKNV